MGRYMTVYHDKKDDPTFVGYHEDTVISICEVEVYGVALGSNAPPTRTSKAVCFLSENSVHSWDGCAGVAHSDNGNVLALAGPNAGKLDADNYFYLELDGTVQNELTVIFTITLSDWKDGTVVQQDGFNYFLEADNHRDTAVGSGYTDQYVGLYVSTGGNLRYETEADDFELFAPGSVQRGRYN
jgi:hypothetical protein